MKYTHALMNHTITNYNGEIINSQGRFAVIKKYETFKSTLPISLVKVIFANASDYCAFYLI